MHDPLVVAFTIRRPWPERSSFGKKRAEKKRWEWNRHGPWWRPGSWSPFVIAFGRRWYFPSLVTIWHREPGGRDSGEVCKHFRDGKVSRRWRWHVWHWHIQVVPVQTLRRTLFERCIECGRRYPWRYAPVSHQWDEPSGRWFRVSRRAYHHECSSLVHLRRDRELLEGLVRYLFAGMGFATGESERELLARLTSPKNRSLDFHGTYRLTRLLGYERDENYVLVKQGRA